MQNDNIQGALENIIEILEDEATPIFRIYEDELSAMAGIWKSNQMGVQLRKIKK